jgi:hypothetical protein
MGIAISPGSGVMGTQSNLMDSKQHTSPVGDVAVGEKPHSLGQSILSLLRTASDRLESETQQSLGAAHTVSQELHAAKDRIERLEAEVQLYRERAERAQGWLEKIASEVEDRLLKQSQGKRLQ